MKVLALDYEGTSKEPRRGWGCQLGLAVMDGEDVLASDEFLIKCPRHWKSDKPMRECDAFSLEISGLTLARIEDEGLTTRGACSRLQSFVREHQAGSLPVVAFNFTYDAECYAQMLFDGGEFDRGLREYVPFGAILSPKWTCAYQMAKRMLGDELWKFGLDDVAGHFGLTRSTDVHGALEDAILSGRVYHRLTELARARAEAVAS